MPVENVAAQFAPRIQSPYDVQNALTQGAATGLALQNQRLQVQQQQNVMQQRNGLAQAMQAGQYDLANPAHQAQMVAQFPDVAPALLKTVNEGTQSAAKARLDTSQAAEADAKTTKQRVDLYHQQIGGINDYQSAVDFVTRGAKDPIIGPTMGGVEGASALIAKIPRPESDPDGSKLKAFRDYLDSSAVGAKERLDMQIKRDEEAGRNARTAAEIKGRADTNAATIKKDYGVAAIHEQGANTRNAATLAKDYKVAGIDPQTGNFVGGGDGQGGSLVDMVGQNKVPIATALARVPLGQKEAFTAQIQQKYPNFDPAVLPRRIATEKDFAPGGKSGQQITNANTALHHAGQVADAIEKLNNSDVLPGLVNPVTNLVAQKAFNDTSQGVYKQKVDAMASELRKLYAGASGGGLEELKSWQSNFDPNASKKQQKAYLQGGMELLTGAIQAKRDAFERGMDGTADFGKLLSPESKKVLQRLAPEFAATLGGAPAQGRTVTRTGTDSSGKKVIQYSDGTIEHAN